MPSSGRHILDISKKGPSRAKARGQMGSLFRREVKGTTPRLRQRRRKMRIILACLAAALAAALVGGAAAATHLEQLAIRDVSVSGAVRVAPEAVVDTVRSVLTSEGFEIISRENIFLYPKRAIESKISADFPRVKDVSLARPSLLAQAVVVTLEERAPYAKWCSDACYLMDSTGFVFSPLGDEQTELPYIFRGGLVAGEEPVGQWFLQGRIGVVVGLLNRLREAEFAPQSITVENEKDFFVQLENGPRLIVPFEESHDTIMRNLETTLDTDSLRERLPTLQYIDLRYGNRVYYK